jgi:hypothetical protein
MTMYENASRSEMPPPTADEILVDEQLLNLCVHREFARGHHWWGKEWTFDCTGCKETMKVDLEMIDESQLPTLFRNRAARPSLHLPMTNLVLSKIEELGWRVQVSSAEECWKAVATQGEQEFRSGVRRNRGEAIVAVAAAILRNQATPTR